MSYFKELSSDQVSAIKNNLESEFYPEPPEELDEESFHQLPTWRKEDFIEDSSVMFEYLKEKSETVLSTSGSSDRPSMIMKSRKDLERDKSKIRDFLDIIGGDSHFMFHSHTLQVMVNETFREEDIFGVYAEPYDIDFASRIVGQMEIDSLWTSPTLALKLGEKMKDMGYSPDVVESMVVAGEPLSGIKEQKLKNMYPDVDIYMCYGNTESLILAYQCDHLDETNLYHVYDDHQYYEILDFDSDEVADVYGELTITKLWDKSCSPFVRYRTGDRARWVDEQCECGREKILELTGRTIFDSIKMGGFTVYRENFEDALAAIADVIGTNYQIHVEEVEENGEVVPRLRILLTPKEGLGVEDAPFQGIEKEVMQNFEISGQNSYKDMVDRNLFGSMKIEFREEVSDGAKTRTVVDHRN